MQIHSFAKRRNEILLPFIRKSIMTDEKIICEINLVYGVKCGWISFYAMI